MFSEFFFFFKKYVVISVKAQTNVTCEKVLFSLIYLMFTLKDQTFLEYFGANMSKSNIARNDTWRLCWHYAGSFSDNKKSYLI